MSVTFNGQTKIITINLNVTSVNALDVYSQWKRWIILSDNIKYLPAFSVLGGDPLPGAKFLGTTIFIENGWKIRPYEGNHSLTVEGNLYSRDGTSPFLPTIGNFNVVINSSVSNLVDTVATGGSSLTATQVVNEMFDQSNSIETGLTFRQFLRMVGSVMIGNATKSGNQIVFKSAVADNKIRVRATTTSTGNRTIDQWDST